MASGTNNTGAARMGRGAWLALLVGVVVLAAVGALAVLAMRSEGRWLLQAVTSRVFLTAGGVFLIGLLLSVPLAAVLWQAGRAGREARRVAWRGRPARGGGHGRRFFVLQRFDLWNAQRGRDARGTRGQDACATSARATGERGAAIVEFTLVLPFLLMIGMVMAQSALLMAGNVVVHYAAHCAARTAMVTVPLNLGDEPDEARSESYAPRNVLPEFGVKQERIREAALWAVTPISCGSRQIPAAMVTDVQRGIELHFASYNLPRPGWLDSLPHRRTYAVEHTSVTVRPPAGVDRDTGLPTFGEHEDVIVDVSHVFYMGVPYAGRMLSALFGSDGVTLSDPPGGFGVEIHATGRMPNQGAQDFIEMERFQDWRGP